MTAPATTSLVALVDATRSCAHLKRVCRSIDEQACCSGVVMHDPGDAEKVSVALSNTRSQWRTAVCEHYNASAIPRIVLGEYPRAAAVAYLPCEMHPTPAVLRSPQLANRSGRVTPLLPAVPTRCQESVARSVRASGWVAPVEAAMRLFTATPRTSEWSLPGLVAALEYSGRHWRWDSSPMETEQLEPGFLAQRPAITTRSRVLAVVPHYRCEQWLAQCLYSLTSQTRPPDNIVVIDDGSGHPPRQIVRAFPEVTLLSTAANVGPENIRHEVIQTMDYDAYLLQDADDWSSEHRLEHSLLEAERTGAEVVGAQELRLSACRTELILRSHPLDVNRAVSEKIAHYVCHSASLIARSLALRIGGFDGKLQVGGDTDFILRASHVGRIVNLPAFHYYRRMRPDSRTSAAGTGFGSTLRDREIESIYRRAARNQQLAQQGIAPDVVAVWRHIPIEFRHILGPSLANGSRPDKDRVRS